jgi:hypothetical protein
VTSPQLNILPSPSHLPPHSHFRSLFDHDHSLRLKGGLLTMASTCTPSLFSTFPTPILHRVKAAGLAASCRFHHHRPFPSLILSPWGSRNPRLALLSINCDFLYRLEGFWQSTVPPGVVNRSDRLQPSLLSSLKLYSDAPTSLNLTSMDWELNS